MNPKCSVILINWKNIEETISCIECVLQSDYSNFEIIVSDNGYDTSYPIILRKLFPQIDIIENKKNLGFAEGNNVAIRKAFQNDAQYAFVLNTDTIIRKDTVRKLIQVFDLDSKIGIVGALTWELTEPNKHQGCGGYFDPDTTRLEWFFEIAKDSQNVSKEWIDIDFVFGSAMCIRREIAEQVGLFDSSYFCYIEDMELCYRAKTKGWKTVISLNSFIWHKMGSWETGNMSRAISGYYIIRNYSYFIQSYGTLKGRIRRFIDNFRQLISNQIQILKYRFNYPIDNIAFCYAVIQGIKDYLLSRKGIKNLNFILPSLSDKSSRTDLNLLNISKEYNIFIPLPDSDINEIVGFKNQITDLAKMFPDCIFHIWLYPSIVFGEEMSNHNIIFSSKWYPPYDWDPHYTIRWMRPNAILKLEGSNIHQIHFELHPISHHVFSKSLFSRKGNIPCTVKIKQVIEKNFELILDKVNKIDLQTTPKDFIEIEFNYKNRNGLNRIGIAISNIEYRGKNKNGDDYHKIIRYEPMSNDIQTCMKELEQYQNIRLLSNESIRNLDSILSKTDLAIIWAGGNKISRQGLIMQCARNNVPLLIDKSIAPNLPLHDGNGAHFLEGRNLIELISQLRNSDIKKLTQSVRNTLNVYFKNNTD